MLGSDLLDLIFDGDGILGYYVKPGVFVRGVIARYTHFAGPLEEPELPEPERIEIRAYLYRPGGLDERRHAKGTYYLITDDDIPKSLAGHGIKITLERMEYHNE